MLSSHPFAALRAGAAGFHAPVHVTQPIAIFSALAAVFCALPADMLVMLTCQQHEVRRRSADFRAGHHQREVLWFRMLPPHLQAVTHCHRGALSVASQAVVDALFHFRGHAVLPSISLCWQVTTEDDRHHQRGPVGDRLQWPNLQRKYRMPITSVAPAP